LGPKEISSVDDEEKEESSGSDKNGQFDGWVSGSVSSTECLAMAGESSAAGFWNDNEKEGSSSGQSGAFNRWMSSSIGSVKVKSPAVAGESSAGGVPQKSPAGQWLGFIDLTEPRPGEFVEPEPRKQEKAKRAINVIDLTEDDKGDVRSRQDTKGDKGKMMDRLSVIDLDLGDEVFLTLKTWAQGED
jgi:hypothetical protein